jgi:hypothetical protein
MKKKKLFDKPDLQDDAREFVEEHFNHKKEEGEDVLTPLAKLVKLLRELRRKK